MAARAVASGTLSLGLVTVPVKLYTAASSEQIRFNMIAPSGQKCKMPLLDPETDEEVSRSEAARGYEYEKGKFVFFTAEEIKALEAEKTGAIEIEEFVELESIDLVQIEKSYYVKPDKGGDKGFKLFSAILEEKKKVAIATWVSRGKEQLVAIRPYKGGLILHQLYFSHEVRDYDDNCAKVDISDAEFKVARQIMKKYDKGTFDIKKYRDRYADRVMEVVSQKKNGEQVVIASPEAKQGPSDLFAALQATLDAEDE